MLIKKFFFHGFCWSSVFFFFAVNFAIADQVVRLSKNSLQHAKVLPVEWRAGILSGSELKLQGKFKRRGATTGWSVYWNTLESKIEADRTFNLNIPYEPDLKTLELVFAGPSGAVEFHFYTVNVESSATPVASPSPTPEPSPSPTATPEPSPSPEPEKDATESVWRWKNLRLTPSLVFDYLAYSQTPQYADRNSLATTLRLNAKFPLSPRWDIRPEVSMVMLHITRSYENVATLFEYHALAGYLFPEPIGPLNLALHGGWFYNTNLASDASFGHQDFNGPEIKPSVSYRVDDDHEASGYLSMGLLADRIEITSLANYRLGMGLGYTFPFKELNWIGTFEYSQMRMSLPNSSVFIQRFGFGIGIRF